MSRRFRSNRFIFFALAWVGMVFYFTQRWILGPLIPSLMQDFSVSRTALGFVGSASLWGYMVTPIISGVLSDRFGSKYPVVAGILGFSAFTIISGLVTGPGQLFAGRFLTGIGEAFFFVPIMAFTLELFPERPGFYLTLMTSGNSLGWFLGPALAGWLLDFTGSWRWPFVITGLAGIALTVLLFACWPPETRRGLRSAKLLDRAILRRENMLMLILLSLTGTFQLGTEFGFTMWYPAFLKTELLMTATAAGFVAGLFGVGQFFGRPFMGFVSDKIGYRRLGITAALLQGISLMLILSSKDPVSRAGSTFLAGFIGSAVVGSILTYAGLVFAPFKGLALGILVTFGYATASLAPITIGYLGDRYSISTALWYVSIPTAFAAALPYLATCLLKRDGGQIERKDRPSA